MKEIIFVNENKSSSPMDSSSNLSDHGHCPAMTSTNEGTSHNPSPITPETSKQRIGVLLREIPEREIGKKRIKFESSFSYSTKCFVR